MQMTGEELIVAPRDKVWNALNDPEILRECIPGCQSIEKLSDTEFTATVKVKVGPVSASFKGEVTLSNIDAPNSYTISGEGKGGAAGFGKGSADIRLSDAPDGTLLNYDVNASVGGKMAQIGSRLIDGTAKKLAGEFFAKFNELVSEGAAGIAEAAEMAETGEEAAEAAHAVPVGGSQGRPPVPEAPPAAIEPATPAWLRPRVLVPLVIIGAAIIYFLARD